MDKEIETIIKAIKTLGHKAIQENKPELLSACVKCIKHLRNYQNEQVAQK